MKEGTKLRPALSAPSGGYRPLSDAVWVYWPTLLGSVLVAALFPWYVGESAADLRPVLVAVLVCGVFSVILHQWTPRSFRTFGNALPFLGGVALLAATWFALGTFQSPAFLVLFCLPVFAAALVSEGWLEYAIAATAVLAAATSAALSNPRFAWFLGQIDGVPEWLVPKVMVSSDALERADASIVGNHVTTLFCFAIAVFAVAVLGSTTARALRHQARLAEHMRRSVEESDALNARLLDESDGLELIVEPRSAHIVASNTGAAHEESFVDSRGDLTHFLNPDYPEKLRQLLDSEQPMEQSAVLCTIEQSRGLFEISAEPVSHEGRSFKRIRVTKTPGANVAAAALDDLGLEIAVIGPDSRVAFVSRAFKGLFPSAAADMPAARALDGVHGLPAAWWDIAPAAQGSVRFSCGDRHYRAILRSVGAHGPGVITAIYAAEEPAS